eukprot:Platyproteum_vivax@DN7477_c2_g4_i6.p1
MVKELFMEIIYELDGTTATDRNQLIKKLNENLAKPEYANFETPASIEMMEKLQKVNRPVATQHLMVDSELQDMSVRKVVDQVEPREEPQEFFEPLDDIPEEFYDDTRKWAAKHPLPASPMADINYIKIGKIAEVLDKKHKSPTKRDIVLDEAKGEYVMRLLDDHPEEPLPDYNQ